MEIVWYGLSCFKLSERGLATVVTDPFGPEVGLPALKLKAEIVTISHDSPGHNSSAGRARRVIAAREIRDRRDVRHRIAMGSGRPEERRSRTTISSISGSAWRTSASGHGPVAGRSRSSAP
jgi:hypothetical protein